MSYEKGKSFEHDVKRIFKQHGITCFRVTRWYPIDLICIKDGKAFLFEIKVRQTTTKVQVKGSKMRVLRILRRKTGCNVYFIVKTKNMREYYVLELEAFNRTLENNYIITESEIEKRGIRLQDFIEKLKVIK